MKPEEALRLVEIADITVDGRDTVTERIGEFRNLVQKALLKMIQDEPEEIDILDSNGKEKTITVCPSCSEELDIFMRKMKFCPHCGKRLH